MAEYVQLGAVRIWYDEHGSGDPLVLMHGGLVDARFFRGSTSTRRNGTGTSVDLLGPFVGES
jgi:hypothetical protein